MSYSFTAAGLTRGSQVSVSCHSDEAGPTIDLHQYFPQVLIVYSAITQRCCWGSVHLRRIKHSCKWVNSEMATFVLGMNGVIVHHPDIHFSTLELFLRNSVSLGNSIFSECLRVLFL